MFGQTLFSQPLFSQLRSRLGGRAGEDGVQNANARSVAGDLSLCAPRSQSALSAQDIALLLKAINSAQSVSIATTDDGLIGSTVVLGADFECRELLLGECFPAGEQLECAQRHAWLQIKDGDHYLRLAVRSLGSYHGLIQVRIDDARRTRNRRWHPRVYFSGRSAPKVGIRPRHSPPIAAELQDLSVAGLACRIWTQNLCQPLPQGSMHTIELCFNDSFTLPLRVRVCEARYLRTPSAHTRLRLSFVDMDVFKLMQIREFIACVRSH